MADDHVGYGSGCRVVGAGADELGRETAVFHYPQGGENHRYVQCYDTEAADCGDELVSTGGCVIGLPLAKMVLKSSCWMEVRRKMMSEPYSERMRWKSW